MRKVILLLITAMIALTFGSCNNSENVITFSPPPSETPMPTPTRTPSPSPTATPTSTPEPTPTPYEGPRSVLTGLPIDAESANLRPAAIMINNIKEALPMHGLNGADMIYEVLAEGGVTRLLAVYQNPADVGAVGSVRSSRHYFLDLAQGLDAIYVHAGGSPQAYTEFVSRKVDHLDGVKVSYPFFYRDSARASSGYAYEHRLFLNGAKLATYLNEVSKLKREHPEDYTLPLEFADDGTPKGGEAALKISARYSGYKTGVFDYDKETSKYKVSEYGKPMNDGADSTQVSVTNVVILKVSVNAIKGDTSGRINVTLTGEGEGWYACGGKYVEITWSKKSYSAPFVYKLKSTGEDVVFGRGVSYINIIPKSENVSFE